MFPGKPNHSGNRGSNRFKPPAPVLEVSENRSQAIRSTDWRKRTGAVSSPPLNARGNQPESYDENEDIRTRLDSENSFSAPQYRFPRENRAHWESVASAPGWQQPSSSSSISGDHHRDMTRVQLNRVTPVVTKIAGEDITMSNRFSFEISMVDQNNPPSGAALGELRPFDRSTPFRPIPSEEDKKLLSTLQDIVNRKHARNQDKLISDPSSSSETRGCPRLTSLEEEQSSPGSATPQSSDDEAGPSNGHARLPSEETGRFQLMLSRLQNRPALSSTLKTESAPTLGHGLPPQGLPPHGFVDPAIVAMKVKDELSQMRDKGKQKATDSGYGSNNLSGGSDGACGSFASYPLPQEPSPDYGQNKALNPAAAEFQLAGQTDGMPWLSPKKMSRPPLTNVFPDATTGQMLHPPSTVPDAYSGSSRHTTASAVAGPSNGNRFAAHHALTQASGSSSTLPRHIRPPPGFSAPVSSAAAPGTGLPVAAPPSAAHFNTPVSATPMSVGGVNAYNTYPPAAGGAAGVNAYVPVTSFPSIHYSHGLAPTHQQAQAPPLPLALHPGFTTGSTGTLAPPPGLPNNNNTGNHKQARPYFPVTTKPRDHDPVKQQQYEAYLEWRKANEPGYHMKCKMRQANRVVRQYQQQQQLHQETGTGTALPGTTSTAAALLAAGASVPPKAPTGADGGGVA